MEKRRSQGKDRQTDKGREIETELENEGLKYSQKYQTTIMNWRDNAKDFSLKDY